MPRSSHTVTSKPGQVLRYSKGSTRPSPSLSGDRSRWPHTPLATTGRPIGSLGWGLRWAACKGTPRPLICGLFSSAARATHCGVVYWSVPVRQIPMLEALKPCAWAPTSCRLRPVNTAPLQAITK